jgi:hypothetical protein
MVVQLDLEVLEILVGLGVLLLLLQQVQQVLVVRVAMLLQDQEVLLEIRLQVRRDLLVLV